MADIENFWHDLSTSSDRFFYPPYQDPVGAPR